MSAIVSILIFFLVVLVHEFGHFFAAKKLGIRVEEFSIGMGPEIISSKNKETLYSLRALPIGGYVSMENVEEDEPNSFNRAPVLSRMIVILAGAFMNFLLALIILIGLGLFVGRPTTIIGQVDAGKNAEGVLIPGDQILAVDTKPIRNWQEIQEFISQAGEVFQITVLRQGQELRLELKKDQEGLVGISPTRDKSILGALNYGLTTTLTLVGSLLGFLGTIFTGAVDANSLSGPIGIVMTINEAAKTGIYSVLIFLAYISINVGFLNLLPIPALDGFKFWTLVFEGVTGKKIPKNIEAIISITGFFILITLIVFVTINDIGKLRG